MSIWGRRSGSKVFPCKKASWAATASANFWQPFTHLLVVSRGAGVTPSDHRQITAHLTLTRSPKPHSSSEGEVQSAGSRGLGSHDFTLSGSAVSEVGYQDCCA